MRRASTACRDWKSDGRPMIGTTRLLHFSSLRSIFFLGFIFFSAMAAGCNRPPAPAAPLLQRESDAQAADLAGRVKTVRLESARFFHDGKKWAEGPRQFVSTTRYDEKGNTLEEAFYKPNGSLAVKVVYSYDRGGLHAEESVFKADASTPSRLVYHHDEAGRLIEKMIYRADGTFDWKVAYGYDQKGNKSEVAVYQADGSLSAKRRYLYDGEGNEIEEAVYSDKALVSKGTFRYDAAGNRTEELYFLPKGTLSARYRYDYEFDAAGNWIKRTRSGLDPGSGRVDLRSSDVAYRTIGYY